MSYTYSFNEQKYFKYALRSSRNENTCGQSNTNIHTPVPLNGVLGHSGCGKSPPLVRSMKVP